MRGALLKSSTQGHELLQSFDRIGGPAPQLPQPFVLAAARIKTVGRSPMAIGFATATALPEHGGEACPCICKQGLATEQTPQFLFGLIALPMLKGCQGGAGSGHCEIGPGFGRRLKVATRRIPVPEGALYVAQAGMGNGAAASRGSRS